MRKGISTAAEITKNRLIGFDFSWDDCNTLEMFMLFIHLFYLFIYLFVGRGREGVNTRCIMVSVKMVNAKFEGQSKRIMRRCRDVVKVENFCLLVSCCCCFLKFENTLNISNGPRPKLICVICVIRSRSLFRSRYDVRAY